MQCEVRTASGHRAGTTDISWIVGGNKICSAPGGYRRHTEILTQLLKLLLGVGEPDAISSEEQGALAGVEGIDGASDFRGDVGCAMNEVGMGKLVRIETSESGFVNWRGLDVEGDVDPDRAGAATHRQVDCFFQVIADVGGLKNCFSVLGDGSDDGTYVNLLHAKLTHAERLTCDSVEHAVWAFDLAGDEEHGRGVEPRAGDARDRVGAAGTGGDHADAETIDCFRIAFGTDGRGLLMRVAYGRDVFFSTQRLIEMHCAAAGDEEDVLDAEVGEELEDVIRELHQFLW